MPFRPAPALSIASLVVGLALLGCGGSTKTAAGTPAGAGSSQPGAVAPAGASTTKSSGASPTAGATSTTKGSSSPPESQPFTGGSTGTTPGTSSTGSARPATPTKPKKQGEAPISAAQSACERALAQRPGIAASIKDKAQQICKQAASRALSRSGSLEREVCTQIVDSSRVSAEIKAQALARCKSL
jgi:hypothetical protein